MEAEEDVDAAPPPSSSSLANSSPTTTTDEEELLIFVSYVSRMSENTSAPSGSESFSVSLRVVSSDAPSLSTRTENRILRAGPKVDYVIALRLPESYPPETLMEAVVVSGRDPSLLLAASEQFPIERIRSAEPSPSPLKDSTCTTLDLSNGDALELLMWKNPPAAAIDLQRPIVRGFRFPEAPRAAATQQGPVDPAEWEYCEMPLSPNSSNVFALETVGELPCAYSHRIPAQYVEARLTRLEREAAEWRRLQSLCRASHIKFAKQEEAKPYGYASCVLSQLRIIELSAQLHKTASSSANSLPSPFVAVTATSPGDDLERPLGRTNTEYRTQNPLFGTNLNSSSGCEHAHPQLYFIPGTHSAVVQGSSLATFLKRGDKLEFRIYHERFSVKSGVTPVLISRGEYELESLLTRSVSVALLPVGGTVSGVVGHLELYLEVADSPPSTNPFDDLAEEATTSAEILELPSRLYRRVPLGWLEMHLQHQRKVILELSTMLEATKNRLSRDAETSLSFFKSSRFKPDAAYGINPTNLHTSEFHCSIEGSEPTTSAIITVGIPSAHAFGLSQGQGLHEAESALSKQYARAGCKLSVLATLLAADPIIDRGLESALASSSFCTPACDRRDLNGQCVVHQKHATQSGTAVDAPRGGGESIRSTHSTSAAAYGKSAVASIASRLSGNISSFNSSSSSKTSFNSTKSSLPITEASSIAQHQQASPVSARSESDASEAIREPAWWQIAAALETTIAARRSVVIAQALPAIVAAFVHEVHVRSSVHPMVGSDEALSWGRQLSRCGFLVGWESLVSTYGSENVMLQDAMSATRFLTERCMFRVSKNRLGERYTDAPAMFTVLVEDAQASSSLLNETVQVVIELSHASFSAIFGDENGEVLIGLVVAFFNQGVNEKQSLANFSMDTKSFVSQKQLNTESTYLIQEYARRVADFSDGRPAAVSTNPFEEASLVVPASSTLLAELTWCVANSRDGTKDLSILLLADRTVRALGGGRVVSCKSAKDRTAMLVTLENARVATGTYWEPFGGAPSSGENNQPSAEVVGTSSDAWTIEVANKMREFGSRLLVAIKCVGVPAYSFNAIQRVALPTELRPPTTVILSMADSIKKRDLS